MLGRNVMTRIKMVAFVLISFLAGISQAEDLAIQSFNGTGQLTFNTVTTAQTYRVEWAPTPAGPWTNTWASLVSIPGPGSGVVTCSVPMCYRVVASVTADYLVIDLSGGTNASSYPVTYLSAVPEGGWTDEYKTEKLVMRLIPAGKFTMGSPTNELDRRDDETQHQVTLTKGFYIGVFEVTQRQWELVMGNRPSYFNNSAFYASRPVEQVSYYDIRENPSGVDDPAVDWPASSAVNAASFMGKLRAKTGLATFDLPTESQWEYACRAGTTNALNSGMNLTNTNSDASLAEVGRYQDNSRGYSQGCAPSAGTATAGTYQPNAWGLYDMHGNVEEWCLDWYGSYPGTVSDPLGAASHAHRLSRGGSWGLVAWLCRSAFRNRYYEDPVNRDSDGGFRAARTLP
jgi:formylglycine-generating enzyme required for sulfatase activity